MSKTKLGPSLSHVAYFTMKSSVHCFPAYAGILLVLSFLHSFSIALQTIMTANMFDSISKALTSGLIQAAIWATILMGIVGIVAQMLNGLCNFLFNDLLTRLSGQFHTMVHRKSVSMEPVLFDDSKALDYINKAVQGAETAIYVYMVLNGIMTFYLPYFIFMGFYLFSLKPVLAFSLLLIFIPVVISQLLRIGLFSKLEDEVAPYRRRTEYYESCVCSRELFKETRLLGAYGFFRQLFGNSLRLFSKASWKAESKANLRELFAKLITLSGYGCVLFLLVQALLDGDITVGSFAAVLASITEMFAIMEEIVCRHFGELMKGMAATRNWVEFLERPEHTANKDFPISPKDGITLENVSFTYPSAAAPSLKNVSFTVYPGETLAVVGTNGAGKSTLIKLLTGLYHPSQGRILFGGEDISDYPRSQVRARISGVFQTYGQYKMRLGENIAISAVHEKGDVEKAAKQADIAFHSSIYPDGLDTMLSREFDGVDVSGGQWQRIAIARGLYRSHDMIVLDEPTSAIDPVEETNIYQKFAEISRDVISIIVTHRLGSTRIADRIVVMDNGSIVETGTHEELVAAGGKYSEMWRAQAQYYV